ncbi:MAG: 3-hydroxyacyl-CoA dehydrogenase NAD-binding domain-containing protein [Emcibacter sp.]|nr:3-hydroxyacyl-CoA dehydrogenase NAD-binding domain-containing protein [Emcibacter sp.]
MVQHVGIIGAGQMGNGIAHVFAVAGYDVLLSDISEEALQKAVAKIEKNLHRQVSKGYLSEEVAKAAVDRITTSTWHSRHISIRFSLIVPYLFWIVRIR